MKVSVVSPVFNAGPIIDELVKRIREEFVRITDVYEIILVDDGSMDNSWEKITLNCEMDNRIKGIKLSRNFGQHYAITAGLEVSMGDFVIVMDCDLQDDPKYFGDLVNKAKAGANIVYTIKTERNHGFLKNMSADFFYKIFNLLQFFTR